MVRVVSIALLAWALTGLVAHAAPSLVAARLEASLVASHEAASGDVDIVLHLITRPDGATELPLLALAIGDVTVDSVTASTHTAGGVTGPAGQPLAIEIERLPLQTRVALGIPASGSRPNEPLEITVRYRVSNAVRFEDGEIISTLPVLVPRWRPQAATPRTFEAIVTLPPGYTVVRSFPTGGRVEDDGTVRLDLPATPSMVRIVDREGVRTFLTVERALDVLVIVGLLVLGRFGWRIGRRFA